LPRDADDYYSFHEVQVAIGKFREDRIKNYKLVYPAITSGTNVNSKKKLEMLTGGGGGGQGSDILRKSMKKTGKRRGKVTSSVACATMFQFNKGQTNPDVIKQVSLADVNDLGCSCQELQFYLILPRLVAHLLCLSFFFRPIST
jgi:hypothetical protein